MKLNTEKNKISVIIPAYNAEKFINRSINSVLNQTYQPFEIIIVDDGSTDDTSKIIETYGDKVTYIYQKNAGASSARNNGIKNAKGDWIAFLDSDDEWIDTHLLNFSKTLNLYPVFEWYGAPFIMKDENTKKVIFKVKNGHIKNDCSHIVLNDYMNAFPPQAYLSTPTMIIKKRVFDNVGVFNIQKRTAEDIDMWFRIGLLYPKIGYSYSESAIVYRRQLSLSTSTKWNPKLSIDRYKECEALARNISEMDLKRVQPRIAYWVEKLTKSALNKGDEKTLMDIKIHYNSILNIKFKMILFITTSFPFVLKIVQLQKRK